MTTPTAKTIQIYLPAGEPRGIRIAEITTRIVRAILVPKTHLAQAKQRSEFHFPGVYFLFGEDEQRAKPLVYIGQTEDAVARFDSHNKLKTFWNTAILCVSQTQNFTQSHIRYLEWYCLQQAKQANRFDVINSQISASSNYVTEPMQAELLDVYETISMLISTLGFPVFEPLVKQDSAAVKLYCRGGGSDASGELTEDGLVVYQGSRARNEVLPGGTAYVAPRRQVLMESGILVEQNGELVFTEDYPFSSPSTAAAVILGRSANGWNEWKDDAGRTINELYRETISSEETPD